MSYPPNCGERYQHLLVPEPSWYGPTEFEYAAAIEQSYAINRELVAVWNDIFWKDEARNDYTVTERWRAEYDNWLAEWQNVPEPW